MIYSGIKEVTMTDQDLADFYQDKLRYELLPNQYLLLKNEAGDIVDKYKYDGKKVAKVKYKVIKSKVLDEVKPRNIKQELYFDLLQNPEVLVKCIAGDAGSGKTFLSTAWALQEIERENFQKFVVIKNNVLIKDTQEIGAIPGSETEKLRQHCGFITDITSNFIFDNMIQREQIELVFLGTVRGRNFGNCIILVSEAQNLTRDLIRTIITRVGEKSVIIFDFDIEQVDKKTFEKDSGVYAMTEGLKGHKLFGMVTLDLVERSEVAKLASLF